MIFIMKFIVGFSAIATTVVLWALFAVHKEDDDDKDSGDKEVGRKQRKG